jgi:DNA invertase Pin-like site-specific DNA recombinase
MERELTVREATEQLQDWAARGELVYSERNQRVRQAWEAGLGKSRIAQLTGLARSTVERILREPRP